MLPLDRYLNLVYYWLVSRVHDVKDRRQIDRVLERPAVADSDAPPSWWRGEEHAARTALATARALGLNVQIPAGG